VRVLVIGAAGMLGRKLGERLAVDGELGGSPVSHLSLVDIVEPVAPLSVTAEVDTAAADLAEPGVPTALVRSRPDVVFHLAAVVSAEAEADLDKGYRVNVDGMRLLLEAIRAQSGAGYRPRLVFSSSIAVFGTPLPPVVGDEQCVAPLTSYGTQKAIAELWLADYSRRGLVDGVAIRLPTICVRPGEPNKAASGFFSSIIREPLNGNQATLPVSEDVRHWFASPRAAVGFLLHAATLETDVLDGGRSLNMPGVSATVADEINALEKVAGPAAVRLIRREPDAKVRRIVASWPGEFDARRASALGFRADTDFDEIIRVYGQDELGWPAGVAGR
jgi:nucleoside-diphosphate-sugar epimerase